MIQGMKFLLSFLILIVLSFSIKISISKVRNGVAHYIIKNNIEEKLFIYYMGVIRDVVNESNINVPFITELNEVYINNLLH